MNGAKIVELDLRTLSTECKKKFSDIRDDADNGIQTLLSLEKKYSDKPKKMKSHDFVSPFITTLNTPKSTSKLIDISLSGILHLLTYKLLPKASLISITEALLNYTRVGCSNDILLKTFQIFPFLITYEDYILPSYLLHDIICLLLNVINDDTYKAEFILINTTKATIEQIVLSLCQSVIDDIENNKDTETNDQSQQNDVEISYNKSLLMLLKDLIRIYKNETSLWLVDVNMSTDYAYDLILSIISQHSIIFRHYKLYLDLLKKEFIIYIVDQFNTDMIPHDITLTFKALSIIMTQYIDLSQTNYDSVFLYINKLFKKNIKDPKLDPYSMCCLELFYTWTQKPLSLYYFYLLNQESSTFHKTCKHLGAFLEKGTSSTSYINNIYDKLSLFETRPHANFEIPDELNVENEDVYIYAIYIFKSIFSTLQTIINSNDSSYNAESLQDIAETCITSFLPSSIPLFKYNKGIPLMQLLTDVCIPCVSVCSFLNIHKETELLLCQLCKGCINGKTSGQPLTTENVICLKGVLDILIHHNTNLQEGLQDVFSIIQIVHLYLHNIQQCITPTAAVYEQDELIHTSMKQFIDNSISMSQKTLNQNITALIMLMNDFYPLPAHEAIQRNSRPNEDSLLSQDQLDKYYKSNYNDEYTPYSITLFFDLLRVNISRVHTLWSLLYPHFQAVLSTISKYPYARFYANCIMDFINSLLHIQTDKLYHKEKVNEEVSSTETDKTQTITVLELLKWLNLLLSNEKTRSSAIFHLYDTIIECESFTGLWRYILMPLKKAASTHDCIEAFKSLQMIADDYLAAFSVVEVPDLVSVIAAFVKQTEDNNTSLTSIGLLWKLLDYIILTARNLTEQESKRLVNGFRRELYTCIVPLCYDPRPGIRNTSLQTVIQLLCVQNGYVIMQNYTELFDDCIDVLIEKIDFTASKEEKNPSINIHATSLQHHSRDTIEKQWNETRAIALKGIARIMKLILPTLLSLPQLIDIFTHISSYVCSNIYRQGKEVPIAAVGCLEEMAYPLLQFINENDEPVKPEIDDENRVTLYKILVSSLLETARNNSLLNNVEVDDIYIAIIKLFNYLYLGYPEYMDIPENLRLLLFTISQILSNDVRIGEKTNTGFNINRRKGKLTNICKEIIIILFNMYVHMKNNNNTNVDIFTEEIKKMLTIAKEENMIRELSHILNDLKTISVTEHDDNTENESTQSLSYTSKSNTSSTPNSEEDKNLSLSIHSISKENGIFYKITTEKWKDQIIYISNTLESTHDEKTCIESLSLIQYIHDTLYDIDPIIIDNHNMDKLFNIFETVSQIMVQTLLQDSNEYIQKVYEQIIDLYVYLITNTSHMSVCKTALPSFLSIYLSFFKLTANTITDNSHNLTKSIISITLHYFSSIHNITIDTSLTTFLPPIKGINDNISFEPYISTYMIDFLECDDKNIHSQARQILMRTLNLCGL